MATTKVNDILDRASIILQDTSNTRFASADLLKFFNDGQREVVIYRPDANVTNTNFTCAAGSKQTLPASALRLIDVTRNVNGRAICQISRKMLDESLPDWHNSTADSTRKIEHFIYDASNPKNFYVYPAAENSFQIEVIYSVSPADVTLSNYTSDATTISLDDTYANGLLDYILYRAYQIDSEFAGNAEKSLMHYRSFVNGLGAKTQGDSAADPRVGVMQ